jgi:hypothetical protein
MFLRSTSFDQRPAPCPVPLPLTATTPSSRMPAFNHFRIRRTMRLSPIRCSTKRISHLAHLVEERPDVGVQYEVHPPAVDPDHERIERIMRPAPGPEPIREPEEVLLVDRIQQRGRGPLDDLVLKSRNRPAFRPGSLLEEGGEGQLPQHDHPDVPWQLLQLPRLLSRSRPHLQGPLRPPANAADFRPSRERAQDVAVSDGQAR